MRRRRRPPTRRAAPRPTRPRAERASPSRDLPPVPAFEPPQATAHAICRICGRIVRVSVPPEEVAVLQSFSDRRPSGWTVEGMSFSFTGVCPTCRPKRGD